MKGLVTEPTLPCERKHYNVERVPNCLHVIMTSNHDQVVRADEFSRRYFVLNVSPARMGDKAYFAAIAQQLEGGGLHDLMDLLMGVDLTGWHPQPVPATEALEEQKAITRTIPYVDQLGQWLAFEAESRGLVPKAADGADYREALGGCELKLHTTSLLAYLGLKGTQGELKDVGAAMRALGFEGPKVFRIGGSTGRGYRIGNDPTGGFVVRRGAQGTTDIELVPDSEPM